MDSLENIKLYLSKRINTEEFLSLGDEELEKYMNTSLYLLNTFYDFSKATEDQVRVPIIAEEMLYLSYSNIDFDLFSNYEGLLNFGVEGAVNGTVAYG